jgi:hypothetical protein
MRQRYSDLRWALSFATLVSVLFNGVDLRHALLREADLTFAAFNDVMVAGTEFDRARLTRTVFARVADLPAARGLATARGLAAISLDLTTYLATRDGLPAGLLPSLSPT